MIATLIALTYVSLALIWMVSPDHKEAGRDTHR